MKKISQYIGVIVSITLLAPSTVLCSAEPQQERLARAWGATKEYASKTAKRVGLDNPKERARKRIQKYAGQAQTSLKKFIACLEGKATCSRESIRKVRLYTAIVIAAITILGIGYKVSQKPKEKEIEPEAPRPAKKAEEGERKEGEEIGPIEDIASKAKIGPWQSFSVTFDYYVKKNPDLEIDWETGEGRTIAENVHRFWNQLESKTKFNLEKLGFPANAGERNDLESMRREVRDLDKITTDIDTLLDITSGRSSVDIKTAMIGLDEGDYQALKNFLKDPLSAWIHKNWHSFNDPTKQALARSAFILNEEERANIAAIEELQRGLEEQKRREAEEEERVLREAKEHAKAERARREKEEREGASPPPPEPETADGKPGKGERPESMEVAEPEPPESEEGWGAWIANWWNPPSPE